MKFISIIMMVSFFIPITAIAEDTMNPVFEQIDELITRVESGVSLNSYAESLAKIKIDYKKAVAEPDRQANYLLNDRMKEIMRHLDDYAQVWRFQEIDGFKTVAIGNKLSAYSQATSCPSNKFGYSIPCIKKVILDELNTMLGKAKTAHFDGW